jgi:hypothetical protein
MGVYSRFLIGQDFRWIDYLSFQPNIFIHMVAVTDADYFPGSL